MAEATRVLRKDRRGRNPVTVATVLLIIAAIGVYLGFTKHIPFTHGFRVNAVFESATTIRVNSPVRIAGVNVGKVKSVKRYQDTNMAEVQLEIDKKGLPIHKDATLKIRPRIFLEGNFFVDLSPGTPSAPTLSSGDTIRVTQTSSPVQLDQVLTALQNDTRQDLKTTLRSYGEALDGPPALSDRATPPSDPSTRGQTAAQSINDSYTNAGPAFRGASVVNQALLGEQPHDVSKLIAGLQKVTGALGRNENLLQDWVENFNKTVAIFGDEQANVSKSIALLPSTLHNADTAFAALNAAFPSVRAFSREILPGVRETPATIDAAFPWVAQVTRLLSPNELQGLAKDLQPASRDLATATDAAVSLFPQIDLAAKCLDRVILPTGDVKIQETGNRSQFYTGAENYKEFWYTMVGLAGEGQNFDGNGQMVRFQTGGGTQTLSTGKSNNGGVTQYFRTSSPPVGVRPVYPGTRPPYRPDAPCYKQGIPDLNSARTGPPDGGQGAAAGGDQQTPNAGPVPALPQLPNLPAVNPSEAVNQATTTVNQTVGGVVPGARAARASVAEQLVSRLNPFRRSTARRTAAKRRSAGR